MVYGCELWSEENPNVYKQMESFRHKLVRRAVEAHYLTRNSEILTRMKTKTIEETSRKRRKNLLDNLASHSDPAIRYVAEKAATMDRPHDD